MTIAGKVSREVRKAASAAKRAWAACLRKIFEVDPVRCVKCGGAMKLVAGKSASGRAVFGIGSIPKAVVNRL